MFTPAQNIIFDTLRAGLLTALTISAPLLITALIVGAVMGIFQALTSVQEATLTFVPKVAMMVVVFWVTMTSMTNSMVSYFVQFILPQISAG